MHDAAAVGRFFGRGMWELTCPSAVPEVVRQIPITLLHGESRPGRGMLALSVLLAVPVTAIDIRTVREG